MPLVPPEGQMLKIYVAGPYAHPDPVQNTHIAIQAAEEILRRGHLPYVPHLTLLWHLVVPHPDPRFWYGYDMHWLADCDALYRIPGFSKGADDEEREAKARGMTIYYSYDDLPPGDPQLILRLTGEIPHG